MSATEYRRLVGHKRRGPVQPNIQGGRGGRKAEEDFAWQLSAAGIDGWCREYRWHPERKWRLDFAWPELKVGLEVDGQVHKIRGKFTRDNEKHNELKLAGWVVLRVEPAEVENGAALALVERLVPG